MAQKPDIQYIHQFYVPGSEAQVLELKPVKNKRKKKFVLPQPRQEKKVLIALDVASVCGIVVACVMMTLMIVGIHRLSDVYAQYQRMESYAISMQNENISLRQRYETEIDLDDIREKALGLGMVPVEQVETVSMRVVPAQREESTPWWEEARWFLSQLFA